MFDQGVTRIEKRLPLAVALSLVTLAVAILLAWVPVSHGADTDVVVIPDPKLKMGVNTALGADRNPAQDVTVAEARTLTTLTVVAGNDPDEPDAARVGDLTGLEQFTALKALRLDATPRLTDVSALADLGLTSLTITGGTLQGSLGSIGRIGTLSFLSLTDSGLFDIAPLVSLNKLRTLELPQNEVASLTHLAAMPGVTDLNLSGNRIVDIAPLASRQNLSSLDLSDNRIVNASPMQGYASARLGTTNGALRIEGNRISDLSPFRYFAIKPAYGRQQVFVGPYVIGGVSVPLKRGDGNAVIVPVRPSEGSYDQVTGLLTLADPGLRSLDLSPSWKVQLAEAPKDPVVIGNPIVGEALRAEPGSETRPSCEPVFHWQREGIDLPTDGRDRYVPTAADIGNRISVRVICGGSEGSSAPTRSVSPVSGNGPVIIASLTTQTGVIGDPTNPGITLRIGQTLADGSRVDPASLNVEVTSQTNQSVLPQSGVKIKGKGPMRRVEFDPAGRGGPSAVTFRVSGPSGQTATTTVNYYASVRTTPTSRVLIGQADSSTALDAGDGYLFVADDERNDIGLFETEVSGPAVWNSEVLQHGEVDFEASARKGDTAYFFGSHGNKKAGKIDSGRHVVYSTEMSGRGANARLRKLGEYRGLRGDLVLWDESHGARFGLSAAVGDNVMPDLVHGFNLEGAEFSPDDSEMYLGFRSPAIEVGGEYRALIVPVTNFERLFSGGSTRAKFGEPILLDLNGQAIREIRKNDKGQYLILGGTPGVWTPQSEQSLFVWTGYPEDPPVELETEVTKDLEPHFTNNASAWEGIGAMPEDLVEGESLRLIMDQGYVAPYNEDTENKDWGYDIRKARTDLFTLRGNLGLKADVTESVVFGDQAAQTVGPPQTVTLTNTGSERVQVNRVSVRGEDGQEADFLVASNTCVYTDPGPGASCEIRLRFAPSVQEADRSARLVIESNLPGADRTVTLTGRGTSMREGGIGPTGPTGDKGPQGPKGDRGQAGRDGKFSLVADKSRVKARRGGTVRIGLRAHNSSKAGVRGLRIRVVAPKALKLFGKRSLKVGVVGAGSSRTVPIRFRVGQKVRFGTYTVRIRLSLGDRRVTRQVKVVVRR